MAETLEERVRRLPLRAIVAFAARCASRLQPLYSAWPHRPMAMDPVQAVAQAIYVAHRVAIADDPSDDPAAGLTSRSASLAEEANSCASDIDASAAAHAAAHAAHAAHLVAYAAFAATYDAAAKAAMHAVYTALGDPEDEAATPEAIAAAEADLRALLALELGRYPELGLPIDASESGPLGPLWPDGEPEWFRTAPEAPTVATADTPAPMIVIAWDPEVLSPEEYAELIEAIGDLARAEGGLGVQRLRSQGYGVPCESGVPR